MTPRVVANLSNSKLHSTDLHVVQGALHEAVMILDGRAYKRVGVFYGHEIVYVFISHVLLFAYDGDNNK